jgi:hypothetical protein
MRVIRLFVTACLCLWLTSCIDINENVEIKSNGSGTVSTTTDLSQLVDMMSSFGGEEMEKRKNDKVDTVIDMKSILDTAKNLTADQKALLKNGKVRLRMNLAEKVFNINMQFPFENLEKFQQLNNLLSSGAGGMGSIMKSLMGPQGGNNNNAKDTTQIIDQPAQVNSPNMDELTSVFDFNASNGLIKKTLNREKYKKLIDNPDIQQMKQLSDMGMEMLYTTTYKLPRPIKKVDNPDAKVSDDKKTVIIRQNFLEIFTAPEKFEYTIQY